MNIGLVLLYKYNGKEYGLDGNSYDGLTWYDPSPKPTLEDLESQWDEVLSIKKKQDCKDEAKRRIALTDWSVLPDVNITNKSEFENYRSQLRNLILNPVEDPIFPGEPQPIWS